MMCLMRDREFTKIQKKERYAWKEVNATVYLKDRTVTLRSPYHTNFAWTPGVLKPSTVFRRPWFFWTKDNKMITGGGLHVKREDYPTQTPHTLQLRVEVDPAHLIGADYINAVYSQVTVPQDEYDKVCAEALHRYDVRKKREQVYPTVDDDQMVHWPASLPPNDFPRDLRQMVTAGADKTKRITATEVMMSRQKAVGQWNAAVCDTALTTIARKINRDMSVKVTPCRPAPKVKV